MQYPGCRCPSPASRRGGSGLVDDDLRLLPRRRATCASPACSPNTTTVALLPALALRPLGHAHGTFARVGAPAPRRGGAPLLSYRSRAFWQGNRAAGARRRSWQLSRQRALRGRRSDGAHARRRRARPGCSRATAGSSAGPAPSACWPTPSCATSRRAPFRRIRPSKRRRNHHLEYQLVLDVIQERVVAAASITSASNLS